MRFYDNADSSIYLNADPCRVETKDIHLDFEQSDCFPFIIYESGLVFGAPGKQHGDIESKYGNKKEIIQGRYWSIANIVTFWGIETIPYLVKRDCLIELSKKIRSRLGYNTQDMAYFFDFYIPEGPSRVVVDVPVKEYISLNISGDENKYFINAYMRSKRQVPKQFNDIASKNIWRHYEQVGESIKRKTIIITKEQANKLTESVDEDYAKDDEKFIQIGDGSYRVNADFDYRRNVLTERISSIVYHFCGYSSCLGICERNEFVLSHIARGTADGKINKDYHYLSLTRQKSNKVGFSQSRPVRITIDGDKLNQRYKGGPVDYWGASMGKQQYMKDGSERGHYDMHQSRTENEDRVFSSDPVIPNASEYIMRIDILITTDRDGKYNKWHLQWIQDILKTGFEKLVFVYGDEKSFNAQNNNTINEQIRQIENGEHLDDRAYVGSICGALLDLLNVIFSYEYDRDNIWSACYQKLKEYGIYRYILQKYGLDFVKRVEEELPRKSWNVDSIFANTQNMIDTIRDYDKTLYVRGARMLNDYLREHNLHSLYDVIHYKQKIVEKINSRYYGPRLDWNKTYKCLALADLNYEEGSDYVGGIIVIPSPDTTSIWKIIPQERGYFVDDVMRQNPQHTSRDDDYFRRYLQHIVRNETSVAAFVDFMNKLHVSDESKEEILGYKRFVTATLKASNFDHARYVTQADKDMVEKALEFDV